MIDTALEGYAEFHCFFLLPCKSAGKAAGSCQQCSLTHFVGTRSRKRQRVERKGHGVPASLRSAPSQDTPPRPAYRSGSAGAAVTGINPKSDDVCPEGGILQ